MANLNFVLDVIVKSFDSPKLKANDAKHLKFDATMVNQKIAITTSRINVTDYNPNASIEFLATAKKLRKSIEDNGISFKAMAKSNAIGEGKMMFPDKFLQGIKEGMGDLEHEGSCGIEKNDEEVGKVIFKCRLIIKCEKEDRDESECRRNMDISQADIMFVMAAPKEFPEPHPCDTCKDAMQPEEGDERLQLDLDRYEPIKQPVHAPPEENGGMDANCELKHMTKQFGHVIDSLVTQMNKLNPPTQCLFTDWSGKPSNIKPKEVDRPMPVPLEDWQENGISPIRYCPVCLTAMSWLPKYSPCPKCSNKPKPEKKDEKKNKPTAEQIIQEYVKVPPTVKDACREPCDVDIENSGKATEDQNHCGCICKAGKMCLHCRMRLISADIFEKKMSDTEECPEVKPTSKEDFCVVVEKKEEKCCTQLENVFAELLELYNKKDAAEEAAQMSSKGSQMSSSKKFSPLTSKRESGGQTNSAANNAEKKRVKKRNNVPRRHGWDWKCTDKARKHGWKPGAISRYVFKIMKFFTQCSDDPNTTNNTKEVDEQEEQKQSNKPMLNICKQNGAICITFQSSDPWENPIMFKIVKSDEALILSELKRKLKAKGFPKCSCHKPLMLCVCREIKEKQKLAAELESECQLLGMESCVEKLILTDTSDSEMEYNLDVSPPEAPAQSTRPIKRKSLNNSTQTEAADDLEVKSKYPAEFNPYYRTYDCAVGDRYTGTAFGALGEEVFEDGVFGNQGGGAHGPLADPGGKSRPQTIWGSKPGEAMRGRDGAGGGTRRGPGGAVGGGFGGGGKSIPGAKKQPAGKSAPIPVRMPARYYKAEAEAAEKEKKAAEAAIAAKKKGINIIEYLEKKGTVSKPWNPNDLKEDKNKKTATELVVGKDGLTDAQRARRALLQAPIPPLDTLPRLGKGYPQCDLCSCYPNPYSYQCSYCCDPCYYCC